MIRLEEQNMQRRTRTFKQYVMKTSGKTIEKFFYQTKMNMKKKTSRKQKKCTLHAKCHTYTWQLFQLYFQISLSFKVIWGLFGKNSGLQNNSHQQKQQQKTRNNQDMIPF